MTKKCDSNEKYAYLYKLSHEKLLELLFSAPVPATTPEDEAYVDALEEAILAKENEKPTGLISNVEQQWLEFQKYYYDTDQMDNLLVLDLFPDQENSSTPLKSKSVPVSRFRWHSLGRIVAIAAIIIVLVALTVPVVLGYDNVFEMIGHWTNDYFHFIPAHEETILPDTSSATSSPSTADFDTPQDVLDTYGVTQKIFPTWFPEGFSLSSYDIYTLESINQNEFSFSYSNSDFSIFLLFIQHTDKSIGNNKYQKDIGSVEEYQVANIMYYLYTNAGQSCASWYIDNMECSIYGDISMNELKEMINSI